MPKPVYATADELAEACEEVGGSGVVASDVRGIDQIGIRLDYE